MESNNNLEERIIQLEEQLKEEKELLDQIATDVISNTKKVSNMLEGFNTFQESLTKQLSSATVDFGKIIEQKLEHTKKTMQKTAQSLVNHAQELDRHTVDINNLRENQSQFKLDMHETTAKHTTTTITQLEELLKEAFNRIAELEKYVYG